MGVGQTRVEHHAKIVDTVVNDLMTDYKTLDRGWFPIFDKDGKAIDDGTGIVG